MKFRYRWWGKGDIDASIGIFFDGFSKILSATGILLFVFGMPSDIVLGKIVPGIGLAIFAGNLWYFYEAWSLAKKEQRQDVTAQPFGIGASQLTGWLYLIIGPVYWQTGDGELAFQVGLAASMPCSVERKLLICKGIITGRKGTMPCNPFRMSPPQKVGG